MRQRGSFDPVRFIRPLIVVLLITLLIVIIVYFVIQWRHQPRLSEEPKTITSQKIDIKEKLRHFEFKREKGELEVSADKNYMSEDGLYHLEGKVEVVDFGKKEGQKVWIYGDSVIYDKDWKQFSLTGKARIVYGDLTIESDYLEYDREGESLRTDRGVRFQSPRFSGSSQKIDYSLNLETLLLEQVRELKIIPKMASSFPFIVRADRLFYDRRQRKGTGEVDVQIVHGASKAVAHKVDFEMLPGEGNFKTLSLLGGVKVEVWEERDGRDSRQNQPVLFPESKELEVEASEVHLGFFMDLPVIHSFESKGECVLKFLTASNTRTLIQGESVGFIFNKNKELREFWAYTKAKMITREEGSEESRVLEGDTMNMLGEKDILVVKGSDDGEAKITLAQSEVTAEEIDVFVKNDNVEAFRSVKAVLKPADNGMSRMGVFSNEEPVFLHSQEMRFIKGERRFKFSGGTRIWQERKVLMAQDVDINEESGEVHCQGGVRMTLFYKPQKQEQEREEKIELQADRMHFFPEESRVTYEGKSVLTSKDFTLSAQSINAYLGKENGRIETIKATAGVILALESLEGRGREADYNLEEGTVVLTGSPVLKEKDNVLTEGDKLTFHIGDGRISVETKEGERSVTFIKS